MYAVRMRVNKPGSPAAPAPAPITEKSGLALGEGSGDEYKIRIIRAGQGSSAFYPNEMLNRDLAAAFPKGTRMRANHDGWLTDGGGDITRIMAKTIDDPWAEGDEHFTNIRISEAWSPWVREFGDVIGVSISGSGRLEEQEIDGQIKAVCVELFSAEAAPYNAIDFVEAPGADGRIIAAKEAASAIIMATKISEAGELAGPAKTSEAAPSQNSKKEENTMTPEEIRAAINEGISAALPALTDSVREAVAPVTPDAPEVTASDIAEAVVAADLTEAGRRSAYAQIEAGVAVAEAVAAEQAREKSIRESIEAQLETSGRPNVTEASKNDAEYKELVG